MKHKGIRIALAVIEACSGLCDKKRDKQPLAYADLPLIESRRQPSRSGWHARCVFQEEVTKMAILIVYARRPGQQASPGTWGKSQGGRPMLLACPSVVYRWLGNLYLARARSKRAKQ